MIGQDNIAQFNKIYDETYENTLRYVVSKCGNLSDVNDILQETYFEFYKILQGGKPITNHSSFIVGIANNKVKKHYTIMKRLKSVQFFSNDEDNMILNDMTADSFDLQLFINNKDLSKIAWDIIKAKDPFIGKIFFLHFYSDLTIKEISLELNKTESYVKNCLYRTLHELKHFFQKDGD